LNTADQKKLYGLDNLRAVAISFVFIYHYAGLSNGGPQWLGFITKFGWTGVDLFFVLSGFLISVQLFIQIQKGQPISFKQFFLKRFFRIVPAFLLVVGLYFIFPFFREKESLPPLWKFLTFTQNFGLNIKDFGTFSHAWSLCVEEHFYLFLPTTLAFLQFVKIINKSYWLLIGFFLVGFILRIYSFNHLYLSTISLPDSSIYWYQYVYYPTYNRLDGLLIGVAIAGIYTFYPSTWEKISTYGNLSIGLGIAILTLSYWLCYDQKTFSSSIFGFPVIAIGYGFLVIGAISPSSFLYQFNSKSFSLIATLSYALYLVHKGIIHLTHFYLDNYHFDSSLVFLIAIFNCLLVAYLLHLIIEKPFLKLRNKIILH
jgi:peptidoglycan/LPS O-acetylase OafA/YrhL